MWHLPIDNDALRGIDNRGNTITGDGDGLTTTGTDGVHLDTTFQQFKSENSNAKFQRKMHGAQFLPESLFSCVNPHVEIPIHPAVKWFVTLLTREEILPNMP